MQILAGIILLGVLITFHELGHFLFAKWLGVRVLVFSVGFGPKLFGIRRGETEYRLSAIPLGGYVRMFGESLEEELTPEEKKMSFMHQAIWRKSLIAFAGPLFNFILPVILFFFLLIGSEQVFAPKVGTLVAGGVAERSGLLAGDVITKVNGATVESFNDVAQVIANSPNVDVDVHVERMVEGKATTYTITVRPEAKTSSNPLEKGQSMGRIGIMPTIEQALIVVSERSPLKESGFKNLDKIVSIDGKAINDASQMFAALATIKQNSVIVVKNSVDNAERSITVTENPVAPAMDSTPKLSHNLETADFPAAIQANIEKTEKILVEEQRVLTRHHGLALARGAITELTKDSIADKLGLSVYDRIIAIDGEFVLTPVQIQQAVIHETKTSHVLGVVKHDGSLLVTVFAIPAEMADKISLDSDLQNMLGIALVHGFETGETITRHVGVGEALKRATLQTVDIAVMTAKSIWLLVKREVPATQIGGPIMLFDVASQAAQKGLAFYIFIMCLLSVNLGLLNLLPIPALDGGHLLLFGIEAIQRKPLTMRTRTIATQIGFALLLTLMVFAVWNDLSRLLR